MKRNSSSDFHMSEQRCTTQVPRRPCYLWDGQIENLPVESLRHFHQYIFWPLGMCFWHPCICMHCGIASRLIKTAPTPFSALGKFGKSLSGEIFNQIETNMAIIGFQTKPEQYHNMATIHDVQIGRKSLWIGRPSSSSSGHLQRISQNSCVHPPQTIERVVKCGPVVALLPLALCIFPESPLLPPPSVSPRNKNWI